MPDRQTAEHAEHRARRTSTPAKLVAASILIAAIGASTLLYLETRPLPFTSSRWLAGDSKVRFRMKDSLLAAHAAGSFPDRSAVDRLLGPNDDLGGALYARYFRLAEWSGSPWYLRISFDPQGKVSAFYIAPD